MQVDKNRSWKRKLNIEAAWVFLVVLAAILGVLFISSDGNNITGSAIGIQPADTFCHQSEICTNETVITCTNVTSQICSSGCINETTETCSEQCGLVCHDEKINGVMREVCTDECSTICVNETAQSCSEEEVCEDVTEEQCTEEVVESCATEEVCENASENETAAWNGPENSTEANQTGEQDEPLLNDTVSTNETSTSEDSNETESGFTTSGFNILAAPTQGTPILNTTDPSNNNTNQNLTAYNVSTADVDGDRVKSIFNWQVDGTPISVLNMPFEGINSTATDNAWDYSGYGNNGSENGGVLWNSTGGYDGRGAYEFDGFLGSYINVSYNESLKLGNTGSASLWFKPKDVGAGTRLLLNYCGNSHSNGYMVIQSASGIHFYWKSGGVIRAVSNVLTANTWTHVAFSNDDGSLTPYVDGVNYSVATTGGTITSNCDTFIGGQNVQDWGFNGTIDEVMIFNRSLSPEQISALYNNRTDLIVSQETAVGDVWSVQVTPNDGTIDGAYATSNEVTITGCDSFLDSCKTTDWEVGKIYCLTQDLLGQTSTCMETLNTSVTLDCQGFTIDGDDIATSGVNADSPSASPYTNITIKNCIITDFTRGIRIENINNSLIQNNSIASNTVSGIEGLSAENITIYSNNISNHDGVNDQGINVNSNNFNWNISFNNFTNNYEGIDIGGANNVNITIEDNRFESNTGLAGINFGGDNATVRDNIFLNNARALFFGSGADDNQILNNEFNGSTVSAIDLVSITSPQVFKDNLVNGYPFVHCNNNDSFRSDHQVVDDNRITDQGSAIIFKCDNAVINNLTMRGSQQFTYGLRIAQSNHSIIDNSTFFNNTIGLFLDSTGTDVVNLTIKNSNFSAQVTSGLQGDDAENITVFNNIFEDHTGANDEGIFVNSNNFNWNISFNNFTNNFQGISIGGTNNVNITIEDNRFVSNTGLAGIEFFGDNATVRDNIFLNNARGVFFQSGADDNQILNNEFNGSTTAAIDFTVITSPQVFKDNLVNGYPFVHCNNNDSFRSDHQVVDDNRITDFGSAIIFKCDNAVINNLTMRGSQTFTYGLRIVQSNHSIIDNSTFFNNTIGLFLDSTGTDVVNLTVKNSNFSAQVTSGLQGDDAENITVFNNIFENHDGVTDQGILVNSNNFNWNISFNNFTNNYEGIDIGVTNNVNITIEDNRFESNTGLAGINLGGDNATVRDNIFLNNARALFFGSGADDNQILNNEFNGSTVSAIDLVSITSPQVFKDNLVNGYPFVHCNNNDSFRSDHQVVDDNRITDFGSAIIFKCDNAVINNLTMRGSQTFTYGLRIVQSNHSIIDNSTFFNNTIGLFLDSTGTDVVNLTVKNSNFSAQVTSGLQGDDAENITVFNNIFENHDGVTDQGILVNSNNFNWNISFNNFTNNYQGIEHGTTSNTGFSYYRNVFIANPEGISLSGDNNTFWENRFENNTEALDVEAAAVDNLFYRNNFKNSTTRHIEGGANNRFNLSGTSGNGGNWWDDFDTAGEGCTDGNSDGFCDSPRNSTIHASFTGQDNHPYVNEINFVNTAPMITQPNITPATAFTGSNLSANTTYSDGDSDLGTVNFLWYVNNSNVYNQTNTSITSGTVVITTLNSGNFSKNDEVNVSVFADDGVVNSATLTSDTITIQNSVPEQGTPILNTTDPSTNNTNQNLTAYNVSTADADGDRVKSIFNWQVDGKSITILNTPFEGGSENGNSTGTFNGTRDYAQYLNVSVVNATWNSSGGYDGRGAYYFNGTNNYMVLNHSTLNPASITLSAWIKLDSLGNFQRILTKGAYTLRVNDVGTVTCGIAPESVGSQSLITSTAAISTDVWIYVVCTYDAATSAAALYLNGTSENQVDFAGNDDPLLVDSGQLTIGRNDLNNVNQQFFNGTIDELIIFNRSLSAEQISALYNNRTDLIVSNETQKGDNWSVQVTPNDGTADGNTLISNNVTILNTAPTQGTPILNTTDQTNNNTFQNLTAYNTSTADADNDLVKNIYNWKVNNSLIALLNMPFEGINNTATNNAWDYSGLMNNGSEQGGIFWNSTGGYDGRGAYMFADPGVEYLQGSGIENAGRDGSITISAWIYPGTVTGTQDIFNKGGFGVCFNYGLTLLDDGLASRNANSVTLLAAEVFTVNTWKHAAVSFNSSGSFGYIDGAFVGSNAVKTDDCATLDWTIGVHAQNRLINGFRGYIDDMIIFNRSLSREQISALYNNRTDLIVSQEIRELDEWNVSITPNDGSEDGTTQFSNTVTIEDSTPPSVAIVNPANGSNLSSGLQSFNATVTDSLSSVDTVLFMFTTNTTPFNVTAVTHANDNFGADVNVSTIVEGTHVVTVFANDSFNNINQSENITIFVDRTAPNVTIITTTDGQNYSISSSNQTFNVSLRDTLTGVRNASFSFDNASGTGFNITAVNGSGYWSAEYNVSTLAEGSHVVTIFTYDFSGNLNNTESISFTVDFTAPNVSIITPTDGRNYSLSSSNQAFNVSLRDTLTGVRNASFSFDNSSGTGFNITAVNGSGYWSASYNVSTLAEGSHVVTIFTYDFSGNLNNTESISFTTDFTSPTFSNASNTSENFRQTENFTANITISDSSVGLDWYIFATDASGVWTNRTFDISGLEYNASTSAEIEAAAGTEVCWYYWSNDTLGNTNQSANNCFTVQETPSAAPASGGGGTGSGSAGKQSIYFINLTVKGVTRDVLRGEIYEFDFESKRHSVLIARIKPGEVGIALNSKLVNDVLKEGISSRYDLDGDGVEDLELKNIFSGSSSAKIFFRLIPEIIPEAELPSEVEESSVEEEPAEEIMPKAPAALPGKKTVPLVGKAFFQQTYDAAVDFSTYWIILVVAIIFISIGYYVRKELLPESYPKITVESFPLKISDIERAASQEPQHKKAARKWGEKDLLDLDKELEDLDEFLEKPFSKSQKETERLKITSLKQEPWASSSIIKEGSIVNSMEELQEWIERMLDFKTADQRIKGVASTLTNFNGKEISLALARAKAAKMLKGAYTLDEKKISQLKRYILKRSKKGASGREIISELVDEGWDLETIKMFVMAYC